ncbi:MAG: UDP-N-acetylglucosamine 2-epimerase (non-hydrolyzing) [Lachnospiraceae bacterium]|nr:UDP-N-acetylglucosamine 2-epimerase (non-hydrolyzing) [Lachnospiraceae bacterium]
MKVVNIVGNRPQFIKLAPISRELTKRNIENIIIHTGQHYDENMSDIFFKELGIPQPDINLKVGSGTHAQMTAKAMLKLEEVLIEQPPECLVVYGDTDSTLAAALVASKLCIPIVHVEAGPRTYNKENPEECNRIIVDHLSTGLCTPNEESSKNLKKEGINDKNIFFTGDVMYDEFLYCLSHQKDNKFLRRFPKNYILMTWHRQENTYCRERMEKIINFIKQIEYPIIFPIHPRTKSMIKEYGLGEQLFGLKNIHIIDPVGYKEMVMLLANCKFLISDSGGASKEASFAGKKCIYMLNFDVWPDLQEAGYIQNVDVDDDQSVKIAISDIKEILKDNIVYKKVNFFGDGNAAKKVVDVIEKIINKNF